MSRKIASAAGLCPVADDATCHICGHYRLHGRPDPRHHRLVGFASRGGYSRGLPPAGKTISLGDNIPDYPPPAAEAHLRQPCQLHRRKFSCSGNQRAVPGPHRGLERDNSRIPALSLAASSPAWACPRRPEHVGSPEPGAISSPSMSHHENSFSTRCGPSQSFFSTRT